MRANSQKGKVQTTAKGHTRGTNNWRKGKKIQLKDSKLMKNKSAATHTWLFLKMGFSTFLFTGVLF